MVAILEIEEATGSWNIQNYNNCQFEVSKWLWIDNID